MDNNKWGKEDGAVAKTNRVFITIKGSGTDVKKYGKDYACSFRFPAQKGDEGAVVTNQYSKDGKVEKELVAVPYSELTVFITDIDFRDMTTDDGRSFTTMGVGLQSSTGKEVVLSLPARSSYASDLMHKLPNIDLTKLVKLVPFNFLGDDGKNKVGLNIFQNTEKIFSYYSVYDVEKKTYSGKDGFPVNKETWEEINAMSKERRDLFWTTYFAQVYIFLKEQTEKNIIPKLPKKNGFVQSDKIEYPEEEINPDDIPF